MFVVHAQKSVAEKLVKVAECCVDLRIHEQGGRLRAPSNEPLVGRVSHERGHASCPHAEHVDTIQGNLQNANGFTERGERRTNGPNAAIHGFLGSDEVFHGAGLKYVGAAGVARATTNARRLSLPLTLG